MDNVEEYVLHATFRILRWYRLWPQRGVNFNDKCYRVQVTLTIISFGVIAFGCLCHLCHTFWTGQKYLLADIVEDIVVVNSGAGLFYIILNFLSNRQKILKLVQDLGSFEEFPKPPSFDEVNKNVNTFSKAFFVYSSVAVLIYTAFGILHKEECEKDSIKYDIDRICGLMAPTYVPFNIRTFPNYQIYWTIQAFTCFLICTCGALIMTFVSGIVEIFLTRVVNLKALMSMTFNIEEKVERKKHLRMCIRYHISILHMCDRLNLCFGKLLLMLITFTSLVISLIGFQFMLEPTIKTMLHLIGWIVILFIPCLAGQRIINESSTISLEMYCTEWYTGDIALQKDVQFIIMRANKIMFLDAEGFGVMSFSEFGAVMKTSYSYLALLHQSYN